MSVAEMKLAAFEKLAQHEKQRAYNLSRQLNDLSDQYDETLKKLAQ